MRGHKGGIWTSAVLSMAAALFCGLVCTAAAAVFFAALIFFVLKDMGLVNAFAGAALSAGAYTGAFVYGKFRRRRGIFCGTLCGLLMYLIIAAVGFAVLGEAAGIKKLLLLAIMGAAGGTAGVNSKRPKKLYQ